jgi:hypothetical protein
MLWITLLGKYFLTLIIKNSLYISIYDYACKWIIIIIKKVGFNSTAQ